MCMGAALQFRDDMQRIGGARVVRDELGSNTTISLYTTRPARRPLGLQVVYRLRTNDVIECAAYALLVTKPPERLEYEHNVSRDNQIALVRVLGAEAIRGDDPAVRPSLGRLSRIVMATTATLQEISRQQIGDVT